MTQRELICCSCGDRTSISSNVNNLVQMQDASGYLALFLSDDELAWICRSKCWPKLHNAFLGISEILGQHTPDISLYAISCMVRKYPLGNG